MNLDDLKRRMAARDASPTPRTPPPDYVPPEERGSPCQRCDRMTDSIRCVNRTYWLCPDCAAFHEMIAAKTRRMNEHQG